MDTDSSTTTSEITGAARCSRTTMAARAPRDGIRMTDLPNSLQDQKPTTTCPRCGASERYSGATEVEWACGSKALRDHMEGAFLACAPVVEPEPDVDAAMLAAGFDKRIEPGQATEFPVSGKQNEANEPTYVPPRIVNRASANSDVLDQTTYTGVGHHGQAGRPHVCNPVDSKPSCFDEGVQVERARIERIIKDYDFNAPTWRCDLLAAIRGGDDA